MEKVEADCRRTSRPSPELGRREVLDNGKHVFANLEQRVGDWLQQRLDARNRAAQPDLWWYGHRSSGAYTQRSLGAARSPPARPVFTIARGSIRSSFTSLAAKGLCSTPRGTTNSSLWPRVTEPSRRSMRSSPSSTLPEEIDCLVLPVNGLHCSSTQIAPTGKRRRESTFRVTRETATPAYLGTVCTLLPPETIRVAPWE